MLKYFWRVILPLCTQFATEEYVQLPVGVQSVFGHLAVQSEQLEV